MNIDVTAWGFAALDRARQYDFGGKVIIKSAPPSHPDGGYVIDLDGDRVISQIVVWPSGATEITAMNVDTGQQEFIQHAVVLGLAELESLFDDFLRKVANIERRPG